MTNRISMWDVAERVTGSRQNAEWVSDPSAWPDWSGPVFDGNDQAMPEADAERYIKFLEPKWEELEKQRAESQKIRERLEKNVVYHIQKAVNMRLFPKYGSTQNIPDDVFRRACLDEIRKRTKPSEVAALYEEVCSQILPEDWMLPGELPSE